MVRFLPLLLIATACGGTNRSACYGKHDAAAAERVERECFSRGHTWDNCPTRDDIMKELESSYVSCK